MEERTFRCRGCGNASGSLLLDMGRLPLANEFVRDESATNDLYRECLALVMCDHCRLIQIRDEVEREKLFSSYLWMSSTSQSARAHARWLSARLGERHRKKPRPFLVEVASNDGLFLEHFREAGFDILGVDPSNFASEANARGLPSIRDFFGLAIAERILAEHGPADVIVARNVLGHASALQDLVAGIERLLARDGVLVLEGPYAYFLREELQYDTIFHEHLSYLTLGSVSTLMARYRMKIVDVSFVQMNGGSMLCEIVHEDSPRARGEQAFLDFESIIGLNRPAGWMRFTVRVEEQREAFVGLLRRLRGEGKRVLGYGAAAKCMTMLNFCGVTKELLPAIGDANPRKQGMLCPGVRIPVVSPEQIAEAAPDYVMIGAWNLKDEIVEFFRTKLGYRNHFIVPLPIPGIID